MERLLNDPRDWQYFDLSQASDIVQKFFVQMSYYKTVNVQFHSGNLLEHSVWSLLYAESLLQSSLLTTPQIKKVLSLALLHDIGKMEPYSCKRTKNSMVYFSQPTHPRVGKEYVMGTRPLPILDKDMNIVGQFPVAGLLAAFGWEPESFETVGMVIDHHWDLGEYLRKWNGSIEEVEDYLREISDGQMREYLYYYATIIVSIADVMATQPYRGMFAGGFDPAALSCRGGVGDRSPNIRSKYFPYISNLPKQYSGTNLADKTKDKRDMFTAIAFGILDNTVDPPVNMTKPVDMNKPIDMIIDESYAPMKRMMRLKTARELKSVPKLKSELKSKLKSVPELKTSARIKWEYT